MGVITGCFGGFTSVYLRLSAPSQCVMDLANGLKYEKEKEAVTVEANDEVLCCTAFLVVGFLVNCVVRHLQPEEDPWNVAALKDSGKPWSGKRAGV